MPDILLVVAVGLFAASGFIGPRFWRGHGWQPTPHGNWFTPLIVARGLTRQIHIGGIWFGSMMLFAGSNQSGAGWSMVFRASVAAFLLVTVVMACQFFSTGRIG